MVGFGVICFLADLICSRYELFHDIIKSLPLFMGFPWLIRSEWFHERNENII